MTGLYLIAGILGLLGVLGAIALAANPGESRDHRVHRHRPSPLDPQEVSRLCKADQLRERIRQQLEQEPCEPSKN